MTDGVERARLRTYLTNSGLADDAFFAAVDAEADTMAAELRAACLALPEPTLAETFDWVYAEQTPHLRGQQATHAEYVATFEDALTAVEAISTGDVDSLPTCAAG